MRWPVKLQILVRMILLLAITISAITLAYIQSAISNNDSREAQRLVNIGQLLQQTRFPLTTTVLENMKSLSGAEFVMRNDRNQPIAKTRQAPEIPKSLNELPAVNPADKYTKTEIDGQSFAHTYVLLNPQQVPDNRSGIVHIFLPRQSERSVWWQSSKSPMYIAAIIFPIAILVSFALASQVTNPLARLRLQVQNIAEGNLAPVSPGKRNDEIADLHHAVNSMAIRIADHESQLLQNERLKTLLQIGRSIAHHLRNAATGCKMAIQLLATENPIEGNENYRVALRQVELINNHIKKFLLVSTSSKEQPVTVENIALNKTLDDVMFLLQPSAKHLNVETQVSSTIDGATVLMAREDAEQMMINLISNAISAASSKAAQIPGHCAIIKIDLKCDEDTNIVFSVTDNGDGPPKEIADRIFEPFVSGTNEGTGLGLSLVREIAQRVGGEVSWERIDNWSQFTFKINKRHVGFSQ